MIEENPNDDNPLSITAFPQTFGDAELCPTIDEIQLHTA